MLPNVRVCEIMSKHMCLDSRREGKKLNHRRNEDNHKKRISTCVISSIDSFKSESKMSRTDLDSHANMVVVCKNCTVLNET